jgi:imidazolonepropionase-like amidohydrolase
MSRIGAFLLVAAAATTTQADVVALRGGIVHPVSRPEIHGATVLLDGDRIVAVGREIAVPAAARVVDVSGLHVYPSLIDANTVLGLTEIGSVRGTVDTQETGDVNPNARVEVAINPDSEILPVTRAGGVLVACTAPRGGLIAGTSALIRLEGWTHEDMTVVAPVGLVVNWPDMGAPRRRRGEGGATGDEDAARNRDARLQLLRDTFADARAYAKAHAAAGVAGIPAHDRDPRWEAMLPVLRGELPVFVVANHLEQIRAALAWSANEDLRIVLVSGADAARAAEEIAARTIPVVLTGTYALPSRRWEPYDTPFTVAAKLHAAGVRFCFSTGEAANVRNLPFHAGYAVAYGLPPEAALRALTQDAATILGAGDRLGTLDAGKEATLIVADGDILDIRTHVVRAFIAGRELDLGNRHQRLYERYRARPSRSTGVPAAATARR